MLVAPHGLSFSELGVRSSTDSRDCEQGFKILSLVFLLTHMTTRFPCAVSPSQSLQKLHHPLHWPFPAQLGAHVIRDVFWFETTTKMCTCVLCTKGGSE